MVLSSDEAYQFVIDGPGSVYSNTCLFAFFHAFLALFGLFYGLFGPFLTLFNAKKNIIFSPFRKKIPGKA